MNDYKSAAAYDLTLFDPMRNQFASANIKQKVKNSSAVKLKKIAVTNLVLALIITVMCCLWIGSCTQYNELVIAISSSKNHYEALLSDGEKLEVAFTGKYNLRMIEDYATSELGMCRIESNSVIYIHPEDEDRCEIVSTDGGFAVSLIKMIFG